MNGRKNKVSIVNVLKRSVALFFFFPLGFASAELKSAKAANSDANSARAATSATSNDPFELLDLRHDTKYASDDLLITSGPTATTHLSQYTGQNIILYFWDLKCSDCENQWKKVIDLEKAAGSEHVKFLPIFSGDPDEGPRAHQFILGLPEKMPYWIAAPGFSRDQFVANGLPAVFFLSSESQILGRANGTRDWSAHKNLGALIRKIYSH